MFRDARSSSPTRPRQRLILVAVVLMAVNLRPGLVIISPLLPQLQRDLEMSSATAGLLGAAPPLAFAVAGALTPRAVKAVGLERLSWLALMLIGVCGAARVVSPGAFGFVALSTATYAAMGVGNVLLPAHVKRYFPHRIGAVSATYILMISVGTAIPALSAVPLADLGGWEMSLGAWAGTALLAVGPWIIADRRTPERAASAAPLVAGSRYLPVVALVRSRLAWGLVGVFGINSLNAYAMFTWLPTILTDAGLSAAAAGAYLALFAFIAIPIALVVPWLTIRLRNPFPLIVVFAAGYAIGYAGLLLAPTTATAVWVSAAGLGPGAFPLILTLVNLRSATVEGTAALAGFTQGLGYAIAGLGPFVVGVLRDLQGGWGGAFAFLLCGLVIQVACGVTVARAHTLEEELGLPTTRAAPSERKHPRSP